MFHVETIPDTKASMVRGVLGTGEKLSTPGAISMQYVRKDGTNSNGMKEGCREQMMKITILSGQ